MGFGPFFFRVYKMLNRRADKLELIRIAEAVALEKSIDKELIIGSMENGIAKAAKSKFGSDNEIKVEYTFGYIKTNMQSLVINLHHSSLPYTNN